VLTACGGTATGSGLEIERAQAGELTTTRGTWTYASSEVDVVAILVSERGAERCTTRASLSVDKATAAPDRYDLDDTDCSILELSESGDIVFYGSTTGHDWSPEPLRVDTSAELIELGPWTPGAGAPTYRFTLGAPPCGRDCTCPYLRRRADAEDLVLELGRTCE
jgi:hypothetical protein